MKTSLEIVQILLPATRFVALAGTRRQTTKGFGEDVEDLREKIQAR